MPDRELFANAARSHSGMLDRKAGGFGMRAWSPGDWSGMVGQVCVSLPGRSGLAGSGRRRGAAFGRGASRSAILGAPRIPAERGTGLLPSPFSLLPPARVPVGRGAWYNREWRGVRVVDGAALEKRCGASHREFESPPLRQHESQPRMAVEMGRPAGFGGPSGCVAGSAVRWSDARGRDRRRRPTLRGE